AFSSVISFAVGATCCLLFFLIDSIVGKTPLPNAKIKTAPWYAWLGGVFGAYYVIINILTVPRLGAATVLRLLWRVLLIISLLLV
ncbi:hypothetical protein CU098_001990, partial [Rhizopus stolonifer]